MSQDPQSDLLRATSESVDPIKLARRDLKKALPKRFYKDVTVVPVENGFGLHVDGRVVRTPAKAALVVPTAALAEILAEEWRAQEEWIEPDSMPLTRLVNSAIDGIAKTMEQTATEVAKFAESDLVCYRADEPATLVEAQARSWDPVLAFARASLGARFVCAEGVMFVEQPAPARAAVRDAVDAIAAAPAGALRLAALSVMTSLTGSVLLALAVARDVHSPEEAWAAANVDEDFQMRHWGSDCEALARGARRWRDMEAAAKVFTLGVPRFA